MAAVQRAAMLGRLATELAHELGAPLSTVAGRAELLLSQSIAKEVKKEIGIICQETGRAQRIAKHILEFGRRQPVRQDEVSLNDVARAGIEMYAHPSTHHRVSLCNELAENLPPVKANFDQMLQVVLNLLANAYRAVRQSKGLRKVTVFTRQKGSRTHLGVMDSGPGIDPDIVSRIFDPFFTTHAGDEGSGLGLAVCRKIAESHEGTISVETVAGKGSTFTLDLPKMKIQR
jgi:two-component system NtrC family sensor kinase